MRTRTLSLLVLVLTVLALSGCGAPPPAVPTTTVQPASTPAETPTPYVPAYTPTPRPSPTPFYPTVQPTPLPRLPLVHLPSGQSIQITTIKMFDLNVGWGIGNLPGRSDHVLRTADGGRTWTDVTPPQSVPVALTSPDIELPALPVAAFFLDAATAWAVYDVIDTGVWRTTDGGVTWQSSGPLDVGEQGEYAMPYPILFLDSHIGWLMVHLGAGMSHDYSSFFRSIDGGATWERLFSPTDTGGDEICCKTGIAFINAQVGVITHGQGPYTHGYIEWTQDGGRTWEHHELPPPPDNPDLFDTSFCDTLSPTVTEMGRVLIVVSCTDMNDSTRHRSLLYVTVDGGETWQIRPDPGGSLLFLTVNTGWALSRDIYKTTDGGLTWTKIKSVSWDGQFSFVDQLNGWAVARSDSEIALVHTSDGGRTWEELKPVIAP
jgi:photosystem II stability/assembly factor-like uncharacterized protein